VNGPEETDTQTSGDSTKLFAEERRESIAGYVQKNRKATVAELSKLFDVSAATIRIDLRELEKSNLLVRTHGGAIPPSRTGKEESIDARAVEHVEAKRKIASVAAKEINNGDTVILDTGTTCLELAKILNRFDRLTVVTNDLRIATVIEPYPGIETVFVGGVVRKGFHCAVGSLGLPMLRTITVDKAFMAANGFSIERGATTPNVEQGVTKREMLAVAVKKYLLVDSSKFGTNSFSQFAELDILDAVVTDAASESTIQALESHGIEVLAAER
jgi:DeoR family transcriptional regulator, fructose operon transcriptional repressor